MKDNPEKTDLFFVGDIHGELKTSVYELVERYKIKNANIIYLGDFGVGFGKPKSIHHLYSEVVGRLEKNNLNLFTIRGNHDNRDFFDGTHDFPRLKFLPDHQLVTISGKTIYPVGGGTSVDKDWRIMENNEAKKRGSCLRYWWSGERVTKKYTNLPARPDIIISHEAPMDFEPVIIREADSFPAEIVDQVVEDRDYLSWLIRELKPSRWYHGHYHKSSSGEYLGTLYRGLAINEVYMFPDYE